MQELFTGLYVCGSILLVLASLGLLLYGLNHSHRDPNAMSWSQYWEAQRKRAELEAELEELGKEEHNAN